MLYCQKNAQEQWQHQARGIISATVIAMITRYKTDNDEQYQSRCQVEQWEVPLIEVVLKKTREI